MFLGRHKDFHSGLGHKIIKSATVFAVDTLKVVVNSATGARARTLIKWPVIIWEICNIDVKHVAKALAYVAKYVEPLPPQAHKLDIQGNPVLPTHSVPNRLAQSIIFDDKDEDGVICPRIFLPIPEINIANRFPGNMVVEKDERQ